MQDEVRSLRVRRVESGENVADLGTKLLSKSVVAKYCLTLGYVNVAEDSALVQTARRGDVLGLQFHPHDRDGWQNSQNAEHSR